MGNESQLVLMGGVGKKRCYMKSEATGVDDVQFGWLDWIIFTCFVETGGCTSSILRTQIRQVYVLIFLGTDLGGLVTLGESKRHLRVLDHWLSTQYQRKYNMILGGV